VVAPYPEQLRIVAEIENQLTRLDAGVVALKRVQSALSLYRSALLTAAYDGRLVLPEAELARRENRPYEAATELLERLLVERRSAWASYRQARSKPLGKLSQEKSSKPLYEEPLSADLNGVPLLPQGWCWASLDSLLREPLRNGHSAKSVER